VKRLIICIGNRLISQDCGGLDVYDCLQSLQPLSDGVEVIEGGLAGLNLLPLLEQGGMVVIVDAVKGFTRQGEIIVLSHSEIVKNNPDSHFDHGSGLVYLLTMLPKVYEGELPEDIVLVGLEGQCTRQVIKRAASLSLRIVSQGLKGLD
jgi:hydrogenase maturation protease